MTLTTKEEGRHTYKAHPARIVAMKDLTNDTRYFKIKFYNYQKIRLFIKKGALEHLLKLNLF